MSLIARIVRANKTGTERFFRFSGGNAVIKKIHQTIHSRPEQGVFIKQVFITAVTIVETRTIINVKIEPNCCSTFIPKSNRIKKVTQASVKFCEPKMCKKKRRYSTGF